MPLFALGGFLSDHTYQSRYFDLRVAARLLEPRVLIRGVVDDQVDDHADAALLRRVGELDEVAEGAVARDHPVVVGDVVAVVAAGRALERHQPDRGDAEPVQVVEAAHQPWKSPMPSPLASMKVPTDRQ